MNPKKKEILKAEIRKLLTGEYSDQLKEVSTSAGAGAFNTKYAFSGDSSASGNDRAATAGLEGYKVVSKTKKKYNNKPINEDVDYNVKSDYDAFSAKLKGASFTVKNEFKTRLQKKLLGKKIVLHGSKGYKQFKKDYEIEVADVKVENFYGDTEDVVIVGKDGKDYFVDRDYKIRIIGASEAEPGQQETPAEQPAQQAAAPDAAATQQPVSPATPAPKTDLSKELDK